MTSSGPPKSPLLSGLTFDEFTEFLAELEKDGPRGAVLLGHSLLENLMKRVLQSRMIALSKDEQDRLFGGMGPLGTMSARVRVAYALGMIGKQARAELNHVRDLRNLFAHTGRKIGFDDPEAVRTVKALCPGDSDTDYRKLFIRALKVLIIHLTETISPDATP